MLRAARETFGRRGYEATSMDEIATAAGITKPMLYAYFGSKEGLFGACAQQAARELHDRLREVAAQPGLPPEERMWRGLLSVFEFVEHHADAWRLLYPGGTEQGGAIGAAGRQARHEMESLLTVLFEQTAGREGIARQAAGQAEALAVGLTGATIAMASAWLESASRRAEPKELQALRLMNLVWRGFGDMLEGRLWLPGQAGGP
jgi:AcrR family transcriptional regulator